jgi:hypothetical protein
VPPRLSFEGPDFHTRLPPPRDRYARYVAYTEAAVLPRATTPAAFYDAGGALRPEFRTYVDRLRDIHTLLVARIPDARRLAGQLDSAGKRLR